MKKAKLCYGESIKKQRYRDGVWNSLFNLFFTICHSYIPLHFVEILVLHNFNCIIILGYTHISTVYNEST